MREDPVKLFRLFHCTFFLFPLHIFYFPLHKLVLTARYFMPWIEGLGKMSYEDRLQELDLTTLETRSVRGNLLEMFKIIKGLDRIDYTDIITFSSSELGGHSCKLYKPRALTTLSHRSARLVSG